jgi:hypothetical protein
MLDYDPGTRIALETGWFTRGKGTRIACLSYDNILRSVFSELRQSPAGAARAAGAHALSALARLAVDHVFVLSSDSAQVMEQMGFRGRVSRIPLGFDPALFRLLRTPHTGERGTSPPGGASPASRSAVATADGSLQ